MKYKCKLCGFEGSIYKFKDHLFHDHSLTYSDYLWKHEWEYEGDSVCKVCGKKIIQTRINRPVRFCSKSCIYKSEEFRENSRNNMSLVVHSEKYKEKLQKTRSNNFKELWKEGKFNYKSQELRDKQLDPSFIYAKFKSMGINLEEGGLVYLVKYPDKCKVGFSTNLEARLKYLGASQVLKVKYFKEAIEAIEYELSIHRKFRGKSINDGTKDSTEMYDLSLLEELYKFFD